MPPLTLPKQPGLTIATQGGWSEVPGFAPKAIVRCPTCFKVYWVEARAVPADGTVAGLIECPTEGPPCAWSAPEGVKLAGWPTTKSKRPGTVDVRGAEPGAPQVLNGRGW